jgi:hypothetical protein
MEVGRLRSEIRGQQLQIKSAKDLKVYHKAYALAMEKMADAFCRPSFLHQSSANLKPSKVFSLMVVLLHPASLPIRHSNAGFLISIGLEIPKGPNSGHYKLPFGLTLSERI